MHGGNSRNFCEATSISTVLMLHTDGEHWLCLFFSKKKCIWSPECMQERLGIVWNMMMHGYANFLQDEYYFALGAQRWYRKCMK